METLRGVVLVLAIVSNGLMAGVFAIYANAIMPGLRRTDDRTFVGAFQAVDTAIMNPAFLLTFLGALVTSGGAVVLHLPEGERDPLPWCAVAFALYAFVVVSTIAVNVPRNDAIKAEGDPDRIPDLAGVRRRFDERLWARWNLARAVASTGALACLAWALAEHGEIT
jgi:uncharacterized membrane protein